MIIKMLAVVCTIVNTNCLSKDKTSGSKSLYHIYWSNTMKAPPKAETFCTLNKNYLRMLTINVLGFWK